MEMQVYFKALQDERIEQIISVNDCKENEKEKEKNEKADFVKTKAFIKSNNVLVKKENAGGDALSVDIFKGS